MRCQRDNLLTSLKQEGVGTADKGANLLLRHL
jgi:hypothetical protein